MGHKYRAKCKKCALKFNVRVGGGFFFHLLRCNACENAESIGFDEIGEPHLKYIKGLSAPYCAVSAERDKYIQDTYLGEPITKEEYHVKVEKIFGECKCGGHYSVDAPPRCPKCKSTEIEDTGEIMIHYD